MANAHRTPEERFWSKVQKSDGCWNWAGVKGRAYGALYVNGRMVKAHRYSWEMANGRPVPDGLDVCHTCDNTACVRPDHLWPGTPSQNALDAVAKGRIRNKNKGTVRMTCAKGHSRDVVYYGSDGHWRCLICKRAFNKARDRSKAALAARAAKLSEGTRT